MQPQLVKLCREIKDLAEILAYNGLNLVSQENTRQIEMLMHQASALRLFRTATSLRYLNVELDRFMKHLPAFNAERYVFFLNNCWLLSQAFLSGRMDPGGAAEGHKSEIYGDTSDPVSVEEMDLRLAGLEKIHLEGALFGLIFYFISLNAGRKNDIIKMSILQQPKGLTNPDVFLSMAIPGTDPSIPFYKILKKDLKLKNVKYLERESQIQLDPGARPEVRFSTTASDEDPFPLASFEAYVATRQRILHKISSVKITPFDTSIFNIGYAYVKKAAIVAQRKEGEHQGSYQTAVHVFEIHHEHAFPLLARIQDKPVNKVLVENMARIHTCKEPIDGIFGRLVIERGTLSLFPLACVDSQGIWFPAIDKNLKFSNKDILQQLYQQQK
ncbi:MAG: hypothetical protein Q6365_000800 [Candidatus Sigynarchaeota archaeon]